MNMKKMIGALTAKFAVALMAFGCITGAWGATITVGSSGADYTTLKAAFAAVSDGDTVQLIEDIAYSTTQAWNDKLVVNGKKVTFDLNGHNVTYTRSANPSGPMFYLQNGAELLIDGTGTIVLTPITTSHTVFPCVSMDGNTGLKATLGENVTVYAECFGSVEYNTKNAETGSTFDIYGTIIGNNSSFMNNLFSCSSGVTNFTVNVIGGTLEISKYSDMHVNIQASTETIFNFNMASGKIYCTEANHNAVKFNLYAAVKSTFNITGGYFGSNAPTSGVNNPTRGFSLPVGYGFYPVSGVDYCPYQVGVCEAKIGNVCYPSVSAAIEAATASDFVTLNVDYSDVVTIPAEKTVNFNGGSYTFSGSFTVNGTLRIVGGTYTFNPAAALLGPGCSVTDNGDGTWTVIQSVAQVGETSYTTFADALTAANALGTATIKFLADVDLGSSTINIASGKSITLDLNGNNVSCSGNDGFSVKSGATLVLCDTSDGQSGALTHKGSWDLSDNSGTIEILSGTYNVVNYGVAYNNGSAVLNIKGGTVNSARRAYYKGVTTISGGTINGTISDVATTVITGGVFNNDPTAYVDVENYQVLTNTPSEGYWTVGAPQPVAQIGANKYETLAAAILAAQSGDMIEILDGTWGADAVGTLTTSEALSVRAKSLTIQAASGASPKFTSNVTLGYDDSSTRNATMTVKGLAFENAQLLVGNYAQATVEGCAFSNATLRVIESCSSNYNRTDFVADQVTIKDCTFDGTPSGEPAIRVRNSGNLLITGNTVANSAHNGILLESNGTVNTQVAKTIVVTDNTITEWNAGNVAGGGRGIRADLGGLAAGSTVTVRGNVLRKGTLGNDTPDFMKITGAGSATVDLSGNDWNDMLLSEVIGNGAVYTCDVTPTLSSVVTTRKEPVAQIGANKYESLRAAIEAVPTDGTATTITMIDDSAEAAVITIPATKNVVLDLNGKTVSYTTDAKSVYFLTNKGTLTVKDTSTNADGQILLTAQPDTGYSVECVTVYNLGGTLTLESGTIKNATGGGLAYAVNNSSNAWGAGDDKVSTFNMTGGKVSAPGGDAALRVYQNCAAHVAPVSKNYVNISGGTIVDTGIFVDTVLYTDSGIQEGFADSIDTQINISGGTVNGLIDLKIRHKNNTKLNITGGDFTNAKLWVRKKADEYKGDEPTEPMVSISGGKFAFVTGKAFGLAYDCGATSWTSYEKPYAVSGGVFNLEVPAFACAEGYIPVANTDTATSAAYQFTVGKLPVAQNVQTGEKYFTLAAALDAAQNGDTVKLLSDIALTSMVTIDKSVKIDGNDKTITVTKGDANNYAFYFIGETAAIDCEFKNATIVSTGYQVAIMGNCDYQSTLKVDNVDITCDGECIYANGFITVNATGCEFRHNGMYATGKDPVYYSAIIVGYSGTINLADCAIVSFGNGVSTFPSGGTVTMSNVDIDVTAVADSGNSGYAMWVRNEDYTSYPEYCSDSVIIFESGSVKGNFKVTDTYTGDDPKNRYDARTTVSGGIFSTDPSAYVADGYVVLANEDVVTKDAYPYMVALGNNVTFELGESAPTGAEKPSDGAYAVGTALPLPTYTSADTTFAGWKVAGAGDAIMVLPAGMTGDITLVATWTVAQTIEVITTNEQSTVAIKVTEDWIAANVTNKEDSAESPTVTDIQEALNETADNGLKVWENYVIGQDPSTAVAVGAEQGAEITAMPVSNTLSVQPVDTGFTVEYSLKQVDTNGTTVATIETKPTTDFDIDLSKVSSNAYYVMTATIKTDAGAMVSTVTSTNVIGVLKVESAATTTAVAVPWASYDGTNDISVADIVRTANLTEGDSLKAYDPDSKTYKEWTLGADKTWQPSSTYSTSGTTSGNESAGNADAYKVARGSAVWLTRTDPSQPIYLVGGAASGTVETKLEAAPSDTKSSWNLVGNPTVEPVDVKDLLGAKTGDQVIVPTAGAPKNYVYVEGKGWGYYKTVPYEIDGVKVGVVSVFTTVDTDVPAGTGFWYLNSSTSKDAKINW